MTKDYKLVDYFLLTGKHNYNLLHPLSRRRQNLKPLPANSFDFQTVVSLAVSNDLGCCSDDKITHSIPKM